MIEDLLRDKGFSKEDLIYKIIKDLFQLNLIKIRKKKDSKSLIAEKENKTKIDNYLENNSLINYFPSYEYLRSCVKNGLKEVPRCPICGEYSSIKSSNDFNISCGKKACKQRYLEKVNFEKYGVSNPGQREDVKIKMKETCMRKYGVPYAGRSEEIRDKRIKTCLEKYGGRGPMSDPKVRERSVQSIYKKYGVKNVSQIDFVKKKKEESSLKNYGFKNHLMNPLIKEKIKNTCIEKYGEDNVFKTNYFRKISRKKYHIDNLYFDSSWEVAFYIYHRDKNIEINCTPSPIIYFVDDEEHKYFPDFEVDGKIIEIKGDMMVTKNDFVLPHPSLIRLAEKTGELDRLNKINIKKNECMKNNNVIILKEDDITHYINYVEENYGKKYLESLKNEQD